MKGQENLLKITIAFLFIEINTCEKPGRGADAEIREMIEVEKARRWRQAISSRQKDNIKQSCLQLRIPFMRRAICANVLLP